MTPEEEQYKIDLVRILVGDTPQSIFYPVLEDDYYRALLEMNDWDVQAAARKAAMSIAFHLAQVTYREKTGDIEVWSNASTAYMKVLDMLLKDRSSAALPARLLIYGAGTSREKVCEYLSDPDANRSPLAQISPCVSWWSSVKNYPCGYRDDNYKWLIRER